MVGLVGFCVESWVTGRMVAPLKNGELDDDLGERGVRGLCPSELWAPGVRGEEILPLFGSDLRDLRSRLGTVEFRDGMLGGHGGRILQLGLRVTWIRCAVGIVGLTGRAQSVVELEIVWLRMGFRSAW